MRRLLTGTTLGVAWLLLLLYAGLGWFWLLICLLALLMLREYGTMLLTAGGEPPLRPLLIMLGMGPVLAAGSGKLELVVAALVLGLGALTLLTVLSYKGLERPLFFLLSGAFGIFYLGLTLAHFPLLMALEQGRDWLIIASLITAASDIGAFYVGTRLGRHKLCPSLSPGKTVEGLIGGLGAALATVGLTVCLFFPAINLLHALFFTIILALVGVLGDLLESILKRGAGVKDSGAILPGHGGLLDRLDSLLLVVPLLYYLLLLENLAKFNIPWFA